MNEGAFHEPVLLEEVMHYLAPTPGKAYVDCTLGDGGHSLEILKLLGGRGLLIGIDVDPRSLETARRRIKQTRTIPAPVKLVQGNFADLAPILKHTNDPPFGGILLDLGTSTPQLLHSQTGLSFDSDAPLDMRLGDQADLIPASDFVNTWDENELTRLFKDNAEEKWSRRIAKRIVEQRATKPIETGRELATLVGGAIPRRAWPKRIHPATRVFMALRIAVNREFENLEAVLPQAYEALEPGGRLVVISFHSGEDRRVKDFFRKMAKPETEVPWPLPQGKAETKGRMRILTRKTVRPGPEEIERNPRSRSAKLRAAEKI